MLKFTTLIYSLLIMVVLAGCASNDSTSLKNEELNEQTDTEEKVNETALDYDGDGGYLWKVVNGETTMYLLGSIHLGHEKFFPLATEIEEAFENSDVILPEINMFEAEVDKEKINKMALFDDNTTLDDVLSEEFYAKLSDIFEAHGMPVETFNHYQPWFVEGLLADLVTKQSVLTPEYGVDLYFLKRALENDKEIVDLETIETQYEVLSGFSMDTQVQVLQSYIETYEEQADWLNQLGYNWVHGNNNSNRDAFVKQLSDRLESVDKEYKEEFNDTRNINMANKLDEILQNDSGQTYFVMVGSAHVVIDPSVPSELEEKGYKIERIY